MSRGSLPVPRNVGEWLPRELELHHMRPLAITFEHAFAVESLPWHHRDPFDRLLIAQAMMEGLRVTTPDRVFSQYPVSVLPA